MSVIVYIEIENGFSHNHKKTISFSRKYADLKGVSLICVTNGVNDDTLLGEIARYGADKIIKSPDTKSGFKSLGGLLISVGEAETASTFIFANDYTGKWIAPYLSAKLNAGIISGVGAFPNSGTENILEKEVFSGKAKSKTEITSEKVILLVTASNFSIEENPKEVHIENGTSKASAPKLIDSEKVSGDVIPLPDAEKVVSGGRGLQGPENWGMIEELAKNIGAATACSRPVADSDWRPHHEHVGQTGVAIRPNLYIAIGISGAIQHLAGVSGSKVKVVINNDPEAPFFKSADYGIVGDAFEIVPKLNELLK